MSSLLRVITLSFSLVVQSTTSIICAPGQDCHIDCDLNDCMNTIINASLSSYLFIECQSTSPEEDSLGGCQSSTIYCPSATGSQCTIHCIDYHACYSANIYSSANTNLNIQCLEQEGSCLNTDIQLDHTSNFSLSCYGSGELESAACQHVNIDGKTIQHNVHLNCQDDLACDNIDFQARHAANVNIFARGNQALSSSYIYASKADTFNIFCGSEENEYACDDLQIYAPSNSRYPQTQLICEGMGCKKSLFLYSDNGMFFFFKRLAVHFETNVFSRICK